MKIKLLETKKIKMNQEETNPAGIVEVFVSNIWNPNSSAGIPNSTNFAS